MPPATSSGAAEQAYDAIVGPALTAFLGSGDQLGPELEKCSLVVKQAFQASSMKEICLSEKLRFHHRIEEANFGVFSLSTR